MTPSANGKFQINGKDYDEAILEDVLLLAGCEKQVKSYPLGCGKKYYLSKNNYINFNYINFKIDPSDKDKLNVRFVSAREFNEHKEEITEACKSAAKDIFSDLQKEKGIDQRIKDALGVVKEVLLDATKTADFIDTFTL